MNDRTGVPERFWLIAFGVGIAVLAVFNAMKAGQYPLGDPRNDPRFWVVALGISFVLAGIAVVSGIRGGSRRGR
jgi:hypothetical protein